MCVCVCVCVFVCVCACECGMSVRVCAHMLALTRHCSIWGCHAVWHHASIGWLSFLSLLSESCECIL